MNKKLTKIIISFIIFLLALFVSFPSILISKALFIIAYIIIGSDIVLKAFRNIKKGKIFDENFLMTLATFGAFAINEFPEAVAVMLFYQVGEYFQDLAVNKSRKSIASLMDIRPDIANVLRNDEILELTPVEVEIGEIIIVRPGEKIPLDGIVLHGNSFLDMSMLTGESVPVRVKEESEVISGSINKDGLLKIKTTKLFGDSTVSKILDLVENATSKKSAQENFISKFAKYYTPIVVIISLIIAFVLPFIIKDISFTTWIYRACSFLVVSCPCALVISVPLSFFGGIGAASKDGVLIKGSNYLEALANVKIAAFDKTGTLTKGVFEVKKIVSESLSEKELLFYAVHAEHYSNHPIASSIKNKYQKLVDTKIIKDIKEIPGNGVIGLVNDKEVIIGNEKILNKYNIPFDKTDDFGTILYMAIDKKYAGYIVISDEIKSDSKKVLYDLKKLGIQKTIMLTGDKKEVGAYVASQVGVDEVFTQVLPDGKVKIVEDILKEKQKKDKLLFVGDGVNDAPALALSDIGVAMGAIGTDAAIEAADIVIMTDELSKLPKVIILAKRTMKIVKQNIYFAIGIKILVLILSLFGISSMWHAVFADVGVSILAIFNALRLLKVKTEK